ncbi:carboxypeptidase-like regulatory domain-containing protein [Mucilaginibacter sp.]|uniref:carboxypeptidase-like regulatory domain-containing protein n=1 Tax=Mucilaginibacter sp. TaxID=1882438 RepID=UPI002626044B|nr:carboxypeptidase-like regulatory domain-containing protein [Mucilaginibacter sp.]MDB5126325.1 hypothetical protein [Mucilaginibacter sp.]
MQPIQKITIPEACHQQWQQMTAVDNGRHCQQCCKTVTDFTVMSNIEILNYLSAHKDVCGRFDKERLEVLNTELNQEVKIRFGWKKLALAAALASLFTTIKAEAKSPEITVKASPSFKNAEEVPTSDTTAYITIRGKVIGEDDNSPLPGVSIRVKHLTIGALTNANGEFNFKVPVTADSLMISYIGYENYEVKVADLTKESNCVSLKMRSVMLGGAITVVRRVPFYKAWWYKLKRVF